MPAAPPSPRTTVRRHAERGRYERDVVDGVLDEALVCNVGFAVDGRPWVVPTAFARVGDHVYLHGAAGNFALRALAAGAEACVTVTLLDGLVLARSAFHHSMNYRSVMLFGVAQAVTDEG
ncbi:MAG TPA: pyridoxamine 5'-phosphate oxidase family protein [Acidimicrobiales bacterium]|nr:pyridoxamine 5'-phosphate oxidase family protein [Acidimicrobiales bacterium]